MAAAGDPVTVLVKSLSGELLEITFDRTEGEEGLRRELATQYPDEFPFERTRLQRAPTTNNGPRSSTAVAAAANFRQLQNGDMVLAMVRVSSVAVECVERTFDGFPCIEYKFTLDRHDLDIVHLRLKDQTYSERIRNPEEIAAYVEENPMQTLTILYDLTSHKFIFYTLTPKERAMPQTYSQLRRMDMLNASFVHVMTSVQPDLSIWYGSGMPLHSIGFTIPPRTLEEMMQGIRECPLTPENINLGTIEHDASAVYKRRYENQSGGRRRSMHRRKTPKKFRRTLRNRRTLRIRRTKKRHHMRHGNKRH